MAYDNRRRNRGFLAGLLIGGLFAAGIALLSAPQAGVKTRKQIRQAASGFQDKAGRSVQDARSRVEQVTGQAGRRAAELQVRRKAVMKKSQKHLSRAVEETRKAARIIAEG
jgi:gas vesicle protein